MLRILLIISFISTIAGCSVGKNSFSPTMKYSPEDLQHDFSIYEQTLHEAHPGLYWYTSKDTMDAYFEWGRKQLQDSLTEPEFRKVLNYVTSKINCGHTSVRSSKRYSKYVDL